MARVRAEGHDAVDSCPLTTVHCPPCNSSLSSVAAVHVLHNGAPLHMRLSCLARICAAEPLNYQWLGEPRPQLQVHLHKTKWVMRRKWNGFTSCKSLSFSTESAHDEQPESAIVQRHLVCGSRVFRLFLYLSSWVSFVRDSVGTWSHSASSAMTIMNSPSRCH